MNRKLINASILILLSLIAIVLLYFAIELVTDCLYEEDYVVLAILSNATLAVVIYFFVRWINQRYNKLSVQVYGFSFNGFFKNFFLGISISIAIISLILIPVYFIGDAAIEFSGLKDNYLILLIEFTMIHLVVGIWEEMYFRGLLVNTLLKSNVSFTVTGIVSSLLFTLLHFFSFDLNTITPFWVVAVFCLSQVMLYAYILTRSIWTSVGIHFFWDFLFTALEPGENEFGLLQMRNYEDNVMLIDNVTVVVAVVVLAFFLVLFKKRIKTSVKTYQLTIRTSF